MKTNNNEVRKQVQKHILECYNIEDLKEELNALNDSKMGVYNIYGAGAYMVQSGCFLCYYEDIENFLNSLGINPENKKYSNDKMWELYKHLIASNCEKLYYNKEVK